jgi:hypothetical protein
MSASGPVGVSLASTFGSTSARRHAPRVKATLREVAQGWSSPIAIVEHQMDDVPNQAVPSVIADQASSGSKARMAAIGLVCLNWIKGAAARNRGAPLKRYGPPAALTASLFGLACLGWSNIQRPAPTLPRVEINLPAQKTTEESRARRAEAEAMRAAQSLNAEEVSAPEPAKRGLESAKDEPGAGIAEAAGNTSPLPPKPVEKLADGGERVDRIGLKIAALLAVDPVVDHSVSATLARRREQKSSPRRLRSIATSQRAGRSPPAGNHSRIRIWPTGQLIANFGRA